MPQVAAFAYYLREKCGLTSLGLRFDWMTRGKVIAEEWSFWLRQAGPPPPQHAQNSKPCAVGDRGRLRSTPIYCWGSCSPRRFGLHLTLWFPGGWCLVLRLGEFERLSDPVLPVETLVLKADGVLLFLRFGLHLTLWFPGGWCLVLRLGEFERLSDPVLPVETLVLKADGVLLFLRF